MTIMRILLAEDDRQLNNTLTYQLETEGFFVDSCLNGEDALFYGEQNIYDVILLDRMLPYLEGTDVLTSLRKKGIVTPIILITALGTLSDKVTGLDLGADDYLVKPFAFEELLARIRKKTAYPDRLRTSDGFGYYLACFGRYFERPIRKLYPLQKRSRPVGNFYAFQRTDFAATDTPFKSMGAGQ